MDFQALYTRTAELLEDTGNAQWSLALVKQYCNDAARDFAMRTKCYARYSSALSAAATTPTNAFYTLPTDLFELRKVWNDGDELTSITLEQLPDQWDDDTGTPSWYLLGPFGGFTELRVYPYPSAALTVLKVHYTALPATMSADGDSPTGIPTMYHEALVYWAAAQCFRRNFEDADQAKVQVWERAYQDKVLDCIARVARGFKSTGATVANRYV